MTIPQNPSMQRPVMPLMQMQPMLKDSDQAFLNAVMKNVILTILTVPSTTTGEEYIQHIADVICLSTSFLLQRLDVHSCSRRGYQGEELERIILACPFVKESLLSILDRHGCRGDRLCNMIGAKLTRLWLE
jgi:hypothetical protein